MKKLALMIVVMILASTIAATADTRFDPSQYSVEELSAIQDIISNYLSQNENNAEDDSKAVLYNENGICIEFKGIDHYSKSNWLINLYIENNYGEEISVLLNDGRANRFAIEFSNGFTTIGDDSVYLAKPNFDFLIKIDDLNEYGISTLETLDFNLVIKKGGWLTGEKIAEVPVTLELHETVEG